MNLLKKTRRVRIDLMRAELLCDEAQTNLWYKIADRQNQNQNASDLQRQAKLLARLESHLQSVYEPLMEMNDVIVALQDEHRAAIEARAA